MPTHPHVPFMAPHQGPSPGYPPHAPLRPRRTKTVKVLNCLSSPLKLISVFERDVPPSEIKDIGLLHLSLSKFFFEDQA